MPIRSNIKVKPPLGGRIAGNRGISQGLIGAWIINDNLGATANMVLYDSSPYLNNLTVGAGSTFGGLSAGQFGNCRQMIANDIYFINTALNNAPKPGEQSFAFWLRNTGTSGNILNTGNGAGGGGNYMTVTISGSSPGTVSFNLYNGSSYQTISYNFPNANKFYHVVCVNSVGQSRQEIWVNGVKVATGTTYTTSCPGPYSYFLFNAKVTSLDSGTSCKFDSLEFYNRALLPQEITKLSQYPYAFMKQLNRPFYGGAGAAAPAQTGFPLFFGSSA